MDKNKICFIIASNDEIQLRECIAYIKKLEFPNNYNIEMIIIREAPSLAKAYNVAMKSSTAKYKVYLHHDLFIIYKDFIKDFIDIFISFPRLGMLGVMGTKHLPENAIWYNKGEYDRWCADSIDNSSIKGMFHKKVGMDFENKYQKVEAIDGLIMITQYDIPWRDDIFDNWHFYDISQSVEFLTAGYDVGVAKQKQPWCIHNCGQDYDEITYLKYRNKFIEEYMY